MKNLLLPLLIRCCVASGVATLALPACHTPEVQHAVAAGEVCAAHDAQQILQPLEGQGISLLEKVSSALLSGAGKTAFDDGIAQAKSDLSTVPASVESALVDCAIKMAVASYLPLTTGHGFAGGDARLTAAANIGKALLAEHGAGGS